MGIVRAVLLCILLNALCTAITLGQETQLIPPLPQARGEVTRLDEPLDDVERLPATIENVEEVSSIPVSSALSPAECKQCGGGLSGSHRQTQCLHRSRGFCCDGNRSACYVPPFGSRVRYQFNAQIASGQASLMTLYRYDFAVYRGQSLPNLNATGKRQLHKMIRRLERTFAPIQIEASGDADLDEQRRTAVIQEIAAAGYPLSDDQVVIGRPRFPGLSGEEAILVQENLLENTAIGGVVDDGNNTGTTPTVAVPLGF